MGSLAFSIPFLISLIAVLILSEADGGIVGINYGRVANDLRSPNKVVELLKSQGINRVKIYDTDSTVLTALSNTGINVVLALPNELLASTAADQSFSDNWVKANISKYYPRTRIEAIAVGNEVFVDPQNITKYLVPALKNVYKSLVKFNISSIKLSSPIAFSALENSYPSSSGSFKPELIGPVMRPMLAFLRKTTSYLMVNAYPFFAYSANADKISLDYALFKKNPGVVDPGTGLKYFSLFEAQIDAVYAAMKALQYDDVKIVVTETGWPSVGDECEVGASVNNAASYNGNLVKRVLSGKGTPLKPNVPLDVYLFALFNENQKPGPTSERNYGLFYPDAERVYNIALMKKAWLPPVNKNKTVSPASCGGVGGSLAAGGHTWCVANGKAGKYKLQAGLDFACGEGRVDCRPIQKGATCYDPNTIEAHASYAFNNYYQKSGRAPGTCHFSGAAHVVSQPPRYGQCEFSTGH